MQPFPEKRFAEFLEETHHLHDLLFRERSLQEEPSLRKALRAGLQLVHLCCMETLGSPHAWNHIDLFNRHWRDFRNAKIAREVMEEEEWESVSVWFGDDAEFDNDTDAL